MNKKILCLLLATIFLSAIASVYVMGAVTLVINGNRTIASGSSLTGTIATNISIVEGAGKNNMTNCSFWVKSAGVTPNTTYVQVTDSGVSSNWVGNNTNPDTNFTVTWDSTLFDDGNDYVAKATCSNSTDGATHTVNISSSEITGIIIDNHEPTTPSSLSPAQDTVDADGNVAFSCTVNDHTTTSCTVTVGPDTYTGTYSGTSCTKSLTAMPTETYNWYCTASDESNTTKASSLRLNVKKTSSSDEVLALTKINSESGLPLLSVAGLNEWNLFGIPGWFIVVIGIIAIVIISIARRK